MAIEYSEEGECYIWQDDFGNTDTDTDLAALAQRHGVTQVADQETVHGLNIFEAIAYEVVNGCLGISI